MQQTWGWSEVLAATGYADAQLRRQEQRGQVEFEGGQVNGRTRATIWDIAKLRVTRHLCYIGMEPKRSFGIAKVIINLAYKDLIGDRKFTAAAGKKQQIIFAVCLREGGHVAPPRIITVDPSEPDYAAKAFKELVLQVTTNPGVGLLPVHSLVLDSWSKLPDLPVNMRAWIDVSRERMQGIFA